MISRQLNNNPTKETKEIKVIKETKVTKIKRRKSSNWKRKSVSKKSKNKDRSNK